MRSFHIMLHLLSFQITNLLSIERQLLSEHKYLKKFCVLRCYSIRTVSLHGGHVPLSIDVDQLQPGFQIRQEWAWNIWSTSQYPGKFKFKFRSKKFTRVDNSVVFVVGCNHIVVRFVSPQVASIEASGERELHEELSSARVIWQSRHASDCIWCTFLNISVENGHAAVREERVVGRDAGAVLERVEEALDLIPSAEVLRGKWCCYIGDCCGFGIRKKRYAFSITINLS